MSGSRVGHGLDAHRLAPGRRLLLGGHLVPEAPRGADAHSDGDALLHAVADALLSSAGLGDIGDAFPPSDARWRDLDSRLIVEHALRLLGERLPGARVTNVAAAVVLDAPKLGPHRTAIQASLATLLSLPPERVGVTFKTSEGLAGDHVQASVVLLVEHA
jgi:2-C-methyl-D-erythritol 2,4-cyclodiphosphate synthase